MSDTIDRLNAALEGRYRIERELGAGGMATVYLADDLRHERHVAVKVLKPELAAVVGADRFLAEIKTTAGLQHPHILPLHDSGEADGFLFYVMPYVEGESLRDRLDREKQLPVDEAVKIAVDLAEALGYAHRQDVIHRDIKPANILMHEGRPLIADFGIALAVSAAGGGRLTETGLSLGTPHYMSPEQATGEQRIGPVTDIYALGCVLYEMLVGEPPYTGSTPQAILGKIITGDLDTVTELRRAVPANVDAAIRRALEKVPADRFKNASDFARALGEAGFRYGETAAAPGAMVAGPWKRIAVLFATLFVLSSVGLAISLLRTEPPVFVARFESPFREGQAPTGAMEFTPDGSALVYVGPNASVGGGAQLWIRELNAPEARPIRGTETVDDRTYLEISPDGGEVAFAAIGGPLLVVPLEGGPARELAPAAAGAHGWSDDGYVYFQRLIGGSFDGISRVLASGGAPPEILTEGSADALRLLPGGRTAVYTDYEAREIRFIDLETRETRTLTQGVAPRYVSTGHLLYIRTEANTGAGTLMAAPLDGDGALGPAVTVLNGVRLVQGVGFYAVSADGTLAYASGTPGGAASSLVWVDLAGREEELPVDRRVYVSPRISPDGRRVAVAEVTGDEADLWALDLERLSRQRVTFGGVNRYFPVWAPAGDALVASNGAADGNVVYRTPSDGSGRLDTLLALEGMQYPTSFSPDGRFLAYYDRMTERTHRDVWVLPMGGEPQPFVGTPFQDLAPAFSPDGRWLAYVSNKSGRTEIYLQPYPGPGPEGVLSTEGGSEPVWSRDGSELFYRSNDQMMVVDLSDPERPGAPRPLWPDPYERDPNGVANYDVHPDGQRFLMIRQEGLDQGVILVLNWFEELRERIGS